MVGRPVDQRLFIILVGFGVQLAIGAVNTGAISVVAVVTDDGVVVTERLASVSRQQNE